MPTLQQLHIEEIELDKSNPRIQRALEMYGDHITAERIALALKEGSDEGPNALSSFTKLKKSIIKNGGIITPIIVNRKMNRDVCVEGNTRLWIYRELKSSVRNGTWSTIPSLVYENANQEQMDAIRLQAHLIGPRQWDPYSKARYLTHLWENELLAYEEIIEYCGGNRNDVEKNIAAYKMVETFYRPLVEDTDFDHTRFSGFVEFQIPRVNYAVFQAGFNQTDFSKWLHERRIYPLQHVRKLPEIFNDEEAKKAFFEFNSEEAVKILQRPTCDELVDNLEIEDLLEGICNKLGIMSYEDSLCLRNDRDSLRSLCAALSNSMRVIEFFSDSVCKDMES